MAERQTETANSTLRVSGLDIVRGAVMVLMAIDHVRVYSGVPAGGPTAGIFFTRWITHFCAPAFAFLAGTSAFLYGRKLADALSSRRPVAASARWRATSRRAASCSWCSSSPSFARRGRSASTTRSSSWPA